MVLPEAFKRARLLRLLFKDCLNNHVGHLLKCRLLKPTEAPLNQNSVPIMWILIVPLYYLKTIVVNVGQINTFLDILEECDSFTSIILRRNKMIARLFHHCHSFLAFPMLLNMVLIPDNTKQ